MEEGANMIENVSAFNRYIVDLQKMDEVYKLEDKVVMLLTSLPPSYKHFHVTLMLGKGTSKYEAVKQDILNYDKMLQHAGDSFQGEGLVARTR